MSEHTDSHDTENSGAERITDDELLEDLQRVADEVGGAPTVREYNERGEYTPRTFIDRFGTWVSALNEAGYDTDRGWRGRSRDELIADLQDAADELGADVTFTEFKAYAREHDVATPETYTARFGGWNAAKEAAGLEITQQRSITTEELEADIRRVADEVGGAPTISDYREHGEYAVTTARQRFGSWEAVKHVADPNATTGRGEVTQEDIIEDLQRVAEKIGSDAVKMDEYDEHGEYAASTAQRKFGSWTAAKEAAGLAAGRGVSTEELKADIRRVADEVGGALTAAEYNERGEYTATTAQRKFGSWNAAKEAADVTTE